MLFELRDQDVPQRHRRSANLGADDLKSTADALPGRGDVSVGERGRQILVLGNGRNHRHQMGLTSPVVADNQQSTVVVRLVELELWYDETRKLLAHLGRNHVGAGQLSSCIGLICVA